MKYVNNQAGIYAGKEGFDIYVEGNTHLKGGVIDSEATPDRNKLDTGTLTYEDIENKAKYESDSQGISFDTAKGAKENEKGITPNIGVTAKDDAESTTKSAIAKGTIEIRNNPNQDLSTLSRDTANSLNKLDQIFDKGTVEEQKELADKFGKLAFNKLGDLGLKAGSPEKVALDAIIGGVITKIAGGEFATGATSAGLTQVIEEEIAKTKDPALQQWLGYVVGATAAEIAGGDRQSGGSIGASEIKDNWLEHMGEDPVISGLMGLIGYEIVTLANGQKEIVDEVGNLVASCDNVGNWLVENSEGVMETIGSSKEDFMVWAKESSKSQKERATSIPSWAKEKGERPKAGESGKDFAKRVCDEKFGKGNYKTGADSDYNKLKKYGDRNFKK